MVFRIFSIIFAVALALQAFNCSSTQPKEEQQPKQEVTPEVVGPTDQGQQADSRAAQVDPYEALFSDFQKKILDMRYPDTSIRPGFSYKQADVRAGEFEDWSVKGLPLIKDALNKLPEDYVLEITGHADASGPATAEGEKKGNVYYSQIRADAVKAALVKQGIPENRIVTRAAGESELVPNIAPDSAENRRVTFSIIRKEPEYKDETIQPQAN